MSDKIKVKDIPYHANKDVLTTERSDGLVANSGYRLRRLEVTIDGACWKQNEDIDKLIKLERFMIVQNQAKIARIREGFEGGSTT